MESSSAVLASGEQGEQQSLKARDVVNDGALVLSNVRLLDVFKKQRNVRVRSKEWLLKFIDEIYRFEHFSPLAAGSPLRHSSQSQKAKRRAKSPRRTESSIPGGFYV